MNPQMLFLKLTKPTLHNTFQIMQDSKI